MKLGEEREGTRGGVGLKGIPQLFFIFSFWVVIDWPSK